MPQYRVYCLNGVGKIRSAGDSIEAHSDDEAIVLLRAKKLPVACEVWDGNRLVAEIPPRR